MAFEDVLSGLPYQTGVVTRQISAENPTGEKGGGCRWDPDPSDPYLAHSVAALDLGRGWKVRPFVPAKAGETITLAEINGPGSICQFFITSDLPEYRALTLRIYWDGEEAPSVEASMGDFFAMGHDSAPHEVTSAPVTVAVTSPSWSRAYRVVRPSGSVVPTASPKSL